MKNINKKELSEKQKKEIEKLRNLPDSEIDTSEIPEWTQKDFVKAVRFYSVFKPKKKQITTRIDADILLWLKKKSKHYQTLLNKILRDAMKKENENVQ